jgi:chloramphenicol-sensitive protein RarD
LTNGRAKYFIAAILSTVIWGFFAIPLRNMKAYPSTQILCFRIFSSLAITWLIILLFRRKQLAEDLRVLRSGGPESRNAIRLILVASLLVTGNWYAFIYATNNVSIRSAAFAYMVCPLITAAGGFILLKEPLTKAKSAGLVLALVSIIILAKGALIDMAWSVIIAALYAFYLIIQRVLSNIDKFNMLGIQLIISAILILPVYFYSGYSVPAEPEFWMNILLIAVMFTIVPLYLSLYALTGIPSSTLGIIIYLNPIIAFAVAFIYFQEQANSLQILAYSLLLAAVVIFNQKLIAGILKKNQR